MTKIFLDNSATTSIDKRVFEEMKKYFTEDFGNPSSIHSFGVAAKKSVEMSRTVLAEFLNARSKEIIFTGSGTESNNLAIFGTVKKLIEEGSKPEKIEIITTKIEHSSVLECFRELEKIGVKIKFLPVSSEGFVEPKDLRKLININTVLVSVAYANSEIGTIQPIKEIAKEIRHARKNLNKDETLVSGNFPYFHVDASQASQYLNMNVLELGVDMMTLDAQKMYGPKGIGALFVKEGVQIKPIIFGGGQEMGLRSGTENVPLIVGFSKAVDIVEKTKEKETIRVTKLRDEFFERLKKFVSSAIINGPTTKRLPNNINISIPGKSGEFMVLQLDEAGIICSSASACGSNSGYSKVVYEIAQRNGENDKTARARAESALRFSLGRDTKMGDMKKLLNILKML
ncbi:MAG: cysteine desulfurase family protein [Minisyncoccia bacterium]